MHPYVQLFLAGLLPGLLSVVFYALEKKTKFQNWNYWLRQILIGLVFGGIAVLGTEFGVSIVGVTMNVRDAAPLCAGLIFGAPAGIISGVIGGVERYVAAAWGAGAYSKVACSVATCFAGFYAAGLRKFMFENLYKNPLAKAEEAKAKVLLTKLFEFYMENTYQMPEQFTNMIDTGVPTDRVVCDYIAGMTDRYAVTTYEQHMIPTTWKVK